MNRENKRKTFEKGYYKTHRCNDTFSCRVCDRLVFPTPTGGDHRNHCPNCLSSLHVDQEPGDRAADCGGHHGPHRGVGAEKRGVGGDSPGAAGAASSAPTGGGG